MEKKKETRIFKIQDLEIRQATDEGGPEIVGYAAVFNELSEDLGGFREKIQPGFFDDVLEDDVRALFNHDSNYVLGRRTAGTLSLSVDERGLQTLIKPPDTQWANDLLVSMKRGDVNQMSFGWITADDRWEKDNNGNVLRTLIKARELFDVSPVTFPAYPQTSVEARAKAAELTGDVGQADGEPVKTGSGEEQARIALRRRRLELEKLKGE